MDQWVIYAIVGALPVVWYLWGRRRRSRTFSVRLEAARASGITEPATLHPVFDPARCIGSGACVKACPEKAIGIVGGKGQLVDPSHCVGHGACRTSCPHDAIRLVFGTATRGVDIPNVTPEFETNVPGIFIAGELGGMGLIRNAAEQGRQAVSTIAARRGDSSPPTKADGALDLVIIGAGPAGLTATLAAKERGLRSVTLEQESSFGGTVYHFPRGKVVMTAPMNLPIVGKVSWREIGKEKLLEFWQGVIQNTGIAVNLGERMDKIVRRDGVFDVVTAKHTYTARHVLLAIGRRGTPRTLGVAGEELPKVVYRLADAEQYRGQKVLVVGGGDAAVEAALDCSAQPDTEVTLSYRSDAFGRIKPKNRDALAAAEKGGRLRVLLKSEVKLVKCESVLLDVRGEPQTFPNDAVIVCAGGILPTGLLKELGVQVETKFGTE